MNIPGNRAFCDTSFFFASLCPRDSNYSRAGEVLEYCEKDKVTLYTSWDVISETVTLLRYRASYKLAVEFLDIIRPALSIVSYDDSVRTAAEKIFKKISKDIRLSYCDALSCVIITQLLDGIPCLTFDGDFRRLGLAVLP